MSLPDEITKPAHYTKHPSGVEPVDIAEHLPFNLGAAHEYVWRAKHKGTEERDLQKALWFVRREAQRFSLSHERFFHFNEVARFNVRKALKAEPEGSLLWKWLQLLDSSRNGYMNLLKELSVALEPLAETKDSF